MLGMYQRIGGLAVHASLVLACYPYAYFCNNKQVLLAKKKAAKSLKTETAHVKPKQPGNLLFKTKLEL